MHIDVRVVLSACQRRCWTCRGVCREFCLRAIPQTTSAGFHSLPHGARAGVLYNASSGNATSCRSIRVCIFRAGLSRLQALEPAMVSRHMRAHVQCVFQRFEQHVSEEGVGYPPCVILLLSKCFHGFLEVRRRSCAHVEDITCQGGYAGRSACVTSAPCASIHRLRRISGAGDFLMKHLVDGDVRQRFASRSLRFSR